MAEKKNHHFVPQSYQRLFANDGKSIGVYNIKRGHRSSRAREFHPHPLTEPCVKVSPHTALHTQRFAHRHNLSQMVLLLSSYPPLCLRVV